jgi:hypothetical protein
LIPWDKAKSKTLRPTFSRVFHVKRLAARHLEAGADFASFVAGWQLVLATPIHSFSV